MFWFIRYYVYRSQSQYHKKFCLYQGNRKWTRHQAEGKKAETLLLPLQPTSPSIDTHMEVNCTEKNAGMMVSNVA